MRAAAWHAEAAVAGGDDQSAGRPLAGWRAPLGRGAAAAWRPAPSLRQGRTTAGADDGPSQLSGGVARAGVRARPPRAVRARGHAGAGRYQHLTVTLLLLEREPTRVPIPIRPA